MNQKTLYLFTRTPLHVGAGTAVGAIDQPVAREKHTGFPIVPGSAIKGVLADGSLYLASRATGERTQQGRDLFGHERPEAETAKSGSIAFGEAKLLAFPVRSARGCFAWVTSPMILERWKRDTGNTLTLPTPLPAGLEIYGDAAGLGLPQAASSQIVLEDYIFEHRGLFDDVAPLTGLLSQGEPPATDTLWATLSTNHLCLISDDMMAHFARNACEIAPHVKINDEFGIAADKALYNQENVPSETLFYAIISELREDKLTGFTVPSIMQIGGDATTGHGFCSALLVGRPA